MAIWRHQQVFNYSVARDKLWLGKIRVPALSSGLVSFIFRRLLPARRHRLHPRPASQRANPGDTTRGRRRGTSYATIGRDRADCGADVD